MYGSYASSATNAPTNSGILYNFMSGTGGAGDGGQFWQDYGSDNFYLRKRWGGTFNGWWAVLSPSNYSSYALPLSGGTLTGNLTFSGAGLFLNRSASATHGISWYSSSFTAWAEYMGPAGSGSLGPTGNLTAPTGTYVNSWGLRSFIENAAGYGWTWESGTSGGQPSIVAELRSSDGTLKVGNAFIGSNQVLHAGNVGTYAFPRSGSWLGDLASYGYTREHGISMTGGSEFVVLSKGGQGFVLVDGSYIAYEGGGFYSSSNSAGNTLLGFTSDTTSSLNFNTTTVKLSGNQILHAGNYGSYALPLTGAVNLSGSFGLNDSKLYLRTNGDNNHYLWNAADDWEEMVAYSGTGFRVASSTGTTLATFTTSAVNAGVALQQGGNQVLHAGNYTSYAPSLTGTGASGTWGIAITGNAGNASSISNAVGGSYVWTSQNYFASNRNTTSDSPMLQAYSNNASGAIMAFHRSGAFAINFGLDSDNVIRFGGWSASANRLQMDMSGNLTMAGNVTAYSDERLKKDWASLPKNFIQSLAQVKSGTYTRIDSEERQVGVSAQGLQKFLEEAVQTDNDGMLSVNYGGAALASAVELAKEVVNLKELSTKQQTQIENQSSEISELKSMINMLVDKVNKLVD
jgi:hypothetical protein